MQKKNVCPLETVQRGGGGGGGTMDYDRLQIKLLTLLLVIQLGCKLVKVADFMRR